MSYHVIIYVILPGEITDEPNPSPSTLQGGLMISTTTSNKPSVLCPSSKSSVYESHVPSSSSEAVLSGKGDGGASQESGTLSVSTSDFTASNELASKKMKPSPIVWGQSSSGCKF